jgi:hypothetical protein
MATRIGLFLVVSGLLLAACGAEPPVLREVRFSEPAPSAPLEP